jgi:hypothetical protein
MARKIRNKLTKYVESQTVFTAESANAMFGGLYGSTEGDLYEPTDPLVAGHKHDGLHKDGSAQKIDLVSHVTGQIQNSNIADNAITVRNVQPFLDQDSAIPESEVIDGDTYYYLDLSQIRSEIPAAVDYTEEIIKPAPEFLEYSYVVGAPSLEKDPDPKYSSRFIFDKVKGAVRGGKTNSTQWDDSNRGLYSFGVGLDNISSGDKSSVTGGKENLSSGESSTVSGGENNQATGSRNYIGGGHDNVSSADDSSIISGELNQVKAGSIKSFIGSGYKNEIDNSEKSGILSGVENYISGPASKSSFIGGGGKDSGLGNKINLDGVGARPPTAYYGAALIGGGIDNEISGAYADYSTIVGGRSNLIDGSGLGTDYAFVGGGRDNEISKSYSTISGGFSNTISGAYSFIGGGNTNQASDQYTVISGGSQNEATVQYAVVSGGLLNKAYGDSSFIGGGVGHTATGSASTIAGGSNNQASGIIATVGGGSGNNVTGNYATIAGGNDNTASGIISFVGGGQSNEASGTYSSIAGGSSGVARNFAESAQSSGSFNPYPGFVGGTAQRVVATWFGQTNSGAATQIFLNNVSEQYTLLSYTTLKFTIEVSAMSSTYNSGGITISGIIKRANLVGTTSIVGTPVVTVDSDPALVGITAAVSADTTNGSLRLDVTGIAATNIRWVAAMTASLVRYV